MSGVADSAATAIAPQAGAAWSKPAGEVLAALGVSAEHGLDEAEALHRRHRYGSNELEVTRPRSALSILVQQFRSLIVLLLVAAGGVSLAMAEIVEALAIFAVIVVNSGIGFFTELRAVRTMETLRHYARIDTTLLRDGAAGPRAAADLVPGDIVLLDAGDLVPADLRIVEAAKLAADESTLTGESLPVSKDDRPLPATAPLLERRNMLFRGTIVTRGTACGVVVATGPATEFGRIFKSISEAAPSRTPLEKRLNALGARLVWAVLAMALVIGVAGVLAGREAWLALQVAIALAVAAIPEGLPIVATIALARGMWRMARRNALVRRLSAVETLGATSVILTDKTGTLTENRMTVTTVSIDGGRLSLDDAVAGPDDALRRLLEIACLCNNASLKALPDRSLRAAGDPTELALLEGAARLDLWRDDLVARYPELQEDPFDADSKRMATLHEDGDAFLVAVKGAPESILPLCSSVLGANGGRALDEEARRTWLGRAGEMGGDGLRTLALAGKRTEQRPRDLYAGLTLIGIVGLEDPPRAGVEDAIRECRDAGITVVMVTGDHAATACNIGTAVGIMDDPGSAALCVDGSELTRAVADNDRQRLLGARVFSRVTPEQKLSLIAMYQEAGNVVAMTGDGVNDAPALKKADIGVAMGKRGTAVAREASAMVLQDDDFRTIVSAVGHGRVIFDNIRKFVVYLMSCNTSEVLVVSLATLAGAPLPLLPLQILFLNLVTDVFPALALGVGGRSDAVMLRPPRPAAEDILTRQHWLRIVSHGMVISATVLAAMAAAIVLLSFDPAGAVTVSFCTLALAQLWHVLNMREESRRWFSNEITRNPWIWAALGLCLLLVVAAVYLPGLSAVLALSDPGLAGWLLIVAMSVVPVLAGPLVRRLTARAR